MTNRLGFTDLVKIDNFRKSQMIRGDILLAAHTIEGKNSEEKDIEGRMHAVGWMDTKPVHMLCTGLATNYCTVNRRTKEGNKKNSRCLQYYCNVSKNDGRNRHK